MCLAGPALPENRTAFFSWDARTSPTSRSSCPARSPDGMSFAVHLAQRPGFDTWLSHVDDEKGDAVVLGDVDVGPREEQPTPSDVSTRIPDLLPVDDPLVAVQHGAGRQAGQVRTGTGLAEQLTP